MTIRIEQAEGRAPQEELEFFLKGDTLTYLYNIFVRTENVSISNSLFCIV